MEGDIGHRFSPSCSSLVTGHSTSKNKWRPNRSKYSAKTSKNVHENLLKTETGTFSHLIIIDIIFATTKSVLFRPNKLNPTNNIKKQYTNLNVLEIIYYHNEFYYMQKYQYIYTYFC